MVTSAAETAKLSVHCTGVVGNERILTPGMAVLAGAQYSCETLRIDPFLDLTNASLCSRAVSFSPRLMRARFDICTSSMFGPVVCVC